MSEEPTCSTCVNYLHGQCLLSPMVIKGEATYMPVGKRDSCDRHRRMVLAFGGSTKEEVAWYKDGHA